jgi:hypothetical protein
VKKRNSFFCSILFGIAALGLLPSPASAAVQLVDAGGQLIGAKGVSVHGKLYDVAFVDGSCSGIFSGCDQHSDFTFNNATTALAAAQSLLDQVFLDTSSGLFDSDPSLTLGCTNILCASFVPFSMDETSRVVVTFALNEQVYDFSSVGFFPLPTTFSTATGLPEHGPYENWARFTPAAVPLPPAILLFGSGLVALFGYAGIGRRRRRQV